MRPRGTSASMVCALVVFTFTASTLFRPRSTDAQAVAKNEDDFRDVIHGVRPRGFGATPYSLLRPVSGGREWYVANTGDDAHSGSRSSPLRTIMRAAELATAGDIVTIERGTYDESVKVKNSGTQARRIVFQAAQRGSVVLTGGHHTFQPTFWTGGPEPKGQWYVTVRGLIFRR